MSGSRAEDKISLTHTIAEYGNKVRHDLLIMKEVWRIIYKRNIKLTCVEDRKETKKETPRCFSRWTGDHKAKPTYFLILCSFFLFCVHKSSAAKSR